MTSAIALNPAVTSLIVALVAGVFGVGGVLLGGRNDHRKWLRERRYEAYSALLKEVSETSTIRMAARVSDLRESGGTPLPEALAAMLPLAGHVEQAAAAVRILGPPGVGAVAERLSSGTVVYLLERGGPDDDQHRASIRETEKRFVSEALKALRAQR